MRYLFFWRVIIFLIDFKITVSSCSTNYFSFFGRGATIFGIHSGALLQQRNKYNLLVYEQFRRKTKIIASTRRFK